MNEDPRRDEARRMRQANIPIADIVRALHVSEEVLGRWTADIVAEPSWQRRDLRARLGAEALSRNLADGLSVAEIAADADVDPRTVYLALRRCGIPPPGKGDPARYRSPWGDTLTEPFLDDAYTGRGLSAAQIAAEVGCTPRTVLDWLHRHGIPRRPARKVRQVTDLPERLQEEILAAPSVRKAVELAGCSVTTARALRRAKGPKP